MLYFRFLKSAEPEKKNNNKMNIFYLLIGVSLLVALIFLGAFIWSVRSGQYDDSETPSMRMLFDDDDVESESETDEEKKNNKK